MDDLKRIKETFMAGHYQNSHGQGAGVPLNAQVNELIPALCRLPFDYLFRDDPVGMAECTLLVQEYLDIDNLHSNLDMYNFEPSNIGADIIYYPDHIPDINRSNFLIKDEKDFDKIKFQGLNQGRLSYLIEYSRAYKKYVGVDFPHTINSLWNLAANLYGLENLVTDALTDPDMIHDMMHRIVCDLQAPLIDALQEEITMPYVVGADAWASLPIVSVDLLKEFDQPYVELLNKSMKSGTFFVSGGYWGFRYQRGKEREDFMDYTIAVGGGTLYAYDPDPREVGPENLRAFADRRNVPLLMSIGNTVLEQKDLNAIVQYTKKYVLAGKNGKTPFTLNYSNLGPALPIENIKTSFTAARTFGRPDADENTELILPKHIETFEEFLKRKLTDNPEGYTFEWLPKSGYSYLG